MSQQIRLLFHRSPSVVRPAASAAARTSADQAAAALPAPPEFVQQLLNEIGLAVEDLQQQHRDSLAEMQQAVVELAVAAASWIVGAAIESDMFAVDELVQSMTDRLRDEHPIRIFMNPEDAQLLQQLSVSSEAQSFQNAEVEIVPDAAQARGIVRAESPRSMLITDMDDRLADIRRIWLENLNDTQTERRADDPAGRRFRRFPERRHTA